MLKAFRLWFPFGTHARARTCQYTPFAFRAQAETATLTPPVLVISPGVLQLLPLLLQDDDGEFWMDWQSVSHFFDVMYMNWNPQRFPFVSAFHHCWNQTHGPAKDLYNMQYNPQVSRGGCEGVRLCAYLCVCVCLCVCVSMSVSVSVSVSVCLPAFSVLSALS